MVHKHTSIRQALLCVCVSVCVVFSEVLTLCCRKGLVTEGVLSAVRHVQESVLVLLLVIQLAHCQTATHTDTQVLN